MRLARCAALVVALCAVTAEGFLSPIVMRSQRRGISLLSTAPQQAVPSEDELNQMKVSELKAVATGIGVTDFSDVFEKKDLVQKILAGPPIGVDVEEEKERASEQEALPTQDQEALSDEQMEELKILSVKTLKTMIFQAGLSSRGLMEKAELVECAARAKIILSREPEDVKRYKELDIVLFARETCPYCVYAHDGLQSRGLLKDSWQDAGLLDVERDRAAQQEFQQLNGQGVPFWLSRKTGKTTSGWNQNSETLDWLVDMLA